MKICFIVAFIATHLQSFAQTPLYKNDISDVLNKGIYCNDFSFSYYCYEFINESEFKSYEYFCEGALFGKGKYKVVKDTLILNFDLHINEFKTETIYYKKDENIIKYKIVEIKENMFVLGFFNDPKIDWNSLGIDIGEEEVEIEFKLKKN